MRLLIRQGSYLAPKMAAGLRETKGFDAMQVYCFHLEAQIAEPALA